MLNRMKSLPDILSGLSDAIVLKTYSIPSTSFNTYYGVLSKDVTLEGYTPIAITKYSINFASVGFYRVALTGNTVELGVARYSQSGSLTGVYGEVIVAYVKTGLVS